MRGGKKALLAAAAAAAVATTTTTTTSTEPTPTAPTETTTTTTTTTSSSTSLPAGYTVRSARDFGVVCDGVKDDTAALQSAFNGLASYQALQLPAGTCLTSNKLSLYGKSNVIVLGDGKDSTILQATKPLLSALVVASGSNVTIRDLQVYSPNTTTRTSGADANGVYVEKSSGVTIERVKVRNVSGGGILFFVVQNSSILSSVVDRSMADAFHVTGASQNILAQYNSSQGAGDDCFASIGYGASLNRNIQFHDNSCSDNLASGVSFEGTIGGKAYRNQLTRTGVAGIRVASIKGWNTGTVSDVDLQDNVLTDVKTRTDVDHGAVMVFTDLASVQNVRFLNTTIRNSRSQDGSRILNYVPTTATLNNVTFQNTTNSSDNGTQKRCFAISGGVTSLYLTANTLNSLACEPH